MKEDYNRILNSLDSVSTANRYTFSVCQCGCEELEVWHSTSKSNDTKNDYIKVADLEKRIEQFSLAENPLEELKRYFRI
jgi:hypothetical protein